MRNEDDDDDASTCLKFCDDGGAGENDGDSATIVDATAAGSDLPSLELQPGTTSNIGSGDIDISTKSGSRRSSGSWMTKIKSSRNAKKDSSTATLLPGGTLESEKKRSSNWRIFK
jgi:hypothetical protein